MMKRNLAFLVIFSIMLLGLSFADEMAKNYSVKGGILWQSGGTAENRADLTVGAEYELPSVDTQGKFTITADYISVKISDGSSDWALPVCVNYKWYGLATNNSYAGLGLGYFAAGGKALAYH
ncbi:MAG: hypothetical protein HYU63_09540, partial [Armatimonadetes bacterium]|nr:hypothetical protein [Armatimonadota bacterium]